MKLNYQCPICGTPLGYEGLCWKCKSEQDRQSVMNWTAEQIKEKQELLISNIQRLADMEDPEFTIFWQLLSYQNAITPEIQSKALTAEIYYPCSINAMKKLVGEQGDWDEVLRKFASAKLTKLANEWLADNDKTDRNPEKEPITEDEFGKRMSLMEIYMYSSGSFSACYDDDDMFWGHVITVDGSLKKGPKRADIEG